MNTSIPPTPLRNLGFAIGCLIATSALTARAQTTNYNVTSSSGISAPFFFRVSGPGVNSTVNNPTFDLRAGNTYTFGISTTAGFHPADLTTGTTFPYGGNDYSNASPQDIFSGTITLTIPSSDYPATLYIICDIHGFFATMNVQPPLAPPPPQNTILSIALAPTNVTLTSTGTNTTYILVPQFSSNLTSGTWLDVPAFSNNFANGTNTTSFGRLEPVCGSNVFLRISQRPPQ